MLNKNVNTYSGNALLSAVQSIGAWVRTIQLPRIRLDFSSPKLAEHEALVPTSVQGTGYFVTRPDRYRR
jgi:hypothetical protein